MESLWKFGGLSPKDLAKRVWKEIQEDDVFGRAAQLSYYFLLALFPLLIFLTSVIGLFLGSDTDLSGNLFNYLAQVVPPAAFQLIESTMREVSEASSGSKVSFGILAALWAASNGMGAITEALNVAYDVKETRPWWKQRVVATSLTIALSVLIIGALILVLSGGKVSRYCFGQLCHGFCFCVGMENPAMANRAGSNAIRFCAHLLFLARRPGAEVGLDHTRGCGRRRLVVAGLFWLSALSALFQFLQ